MLDRYENAWGLSMDFFDSLHYRRLSIFLGK